MKKKVLVSALVLVALIGVGIGAYMLHDDNEYNPLILKCTVSESPAGVSQAGSYKFVKFYAGADPAFWDFAEEEWQIIRFPRRLSDLNASNSSFSWRQTDLSGREDKRIVIDRITGDYIVSTCNDGLCTHDYQYDDVIENGTCIKSAEPARTLKQKF